MYIYINNPITKKKINIYSNLGRSIIKSYIDYINKQTRGGAPRSTRMDIGKEEQLLRKLARKEIIKARDAKTERKREDLTIEIINKLKEKQYKDSDINEAIREVGIRLQRPTKEAQVKRIKNFITLKNKKYSINEINEAMKEALKRYPLMQEVEQIENYIIQKRIPVIDPADIIDAADMFGDMGKDEDDPPESPIEVDHEDIFNNESAAAAADMFGDIGEDGSYQPESPIEVFSIDDVDERGLSGIERRANSVNQLLE